MLHSLHVALFSCCTICCVAHFWGCNFYELHFFHLLLLLCFTFLRVALFSSCTFSCLTLFRFDLCCTHFMMRYFCVVLISCCNFSTLHSFILNSFQVAFSSCCTFFLQHFFYFLSMILIHVALVSCCIFFVFYSFLVPFFPCLRFLIVVLFSYWAISRAALFLR